jgi:ferritin
MLNKKIEKALNEQVEKEAFSSFQYLAMASWLENNGFMGSAQFIYNQVAEEHMHMSKLFHFINEAGGHAKSPAVKQAKSEFKSYSQLFTEILENERNVSESIHELVDLALKEKDYTTFNFLQWYVSEQLEEENLFKEINDKIKMVGDSKETLYILDRDLSSMPNKANLNSMKGKSQ